MIAQLIHTGPHPAKSQDMKGDADEALLIVGVTLFWAAVLPVASVFLAVAALCDRVKVLAAAAAIGRMV